MTATAKRARTGAATVIFTVTRTFDASRERVFKAWSEAAQLERWWGPKGMTISVKKLEFRPGGMFLYRMGLPNGDEWWGRFVYRDIARPERIVFVNSFSDPDGNVTRAPFAPTFPLQMLSTITLEEAGGRTTMILQSVALDANEEEQATFAGMEKSMQGGWNGTLDQLAAHLTKG